METYVRELARKAGFDVRSVDLVRRDFPVVCIVVGLVLIVVERAFTEYKRRRNENAALKLRKLGD